MASSNTTRGPVVKTTFTEEICTLKNRVIEFNLFTKHKQRRRCLTSTKKVLGFLIFLLETDSHIFSFIFPVNCAVTTCAVFVKVMDVSLKREERLETLYFVKVS